MQTIQEYLLELIDTELPAFINVFKALPTDKLDWKPDAKSKSASELGSYMADETSQLAEAMETGIFNFDPGKSQSFTAIPEITSAFESGMEKSKTLITGLNETDWDSEVKMMIDGEPVWQTTKGKMAWGFLLDLIHHRGQLATYIRPMGGQVPSIYGPSADSAGQG